MSGTLTAQCLISFGSNLGNRDALIAEAARTIARHPAVHDMQASRLFETPPIGGPQGQEPFLNAVAAFETDASAHRVLEILQQAEEQLGRQRRRRWDARSIDLDVVLHGHLVGGGAHLAVPHPRYTARQFVLQPACDVAGHYRDPRFGWTLRQLADHIQQAVPSLALVGSDEQTRAELCRRVQSEHSIAIFQAGPMAEPMEIVGNAPQPKMQTHRDASHRSSVRDPATRLTHSPIPADIQQPWVADFVPPLPVDSPADRHASFAGDNFRGPNFAGDKLAGDKFPEDGPTPPTAFNQANLPRLIARMQSTTPQTRWPAPHQMWPSGWNWPEYRLEVDDLDWAVSEVASALDSMQCPVKPASPDGRWWM